ncbi:uncharacterized protein EDB91DRAFT_1047986 [Suillus paluster]|uniref:uncharacterized protein n=1 Tax=Suillus paluster TaxID=48578 RepID=UPI001B85F690|nr:uncharacterized protein EDB91DRAFT_1047986 [Suillus paluster]KAG1748420.1 hypothetical protein EDB91DRAFT_1047986 [Suillus paluster]
MRNGPNRGSFMWGSSTRNSRIERLWVEVGTQFVRCWRAFFSRLERLHGLDIEKTGHLWLLQGLFLDAINDDCKSFREEWNLHPIAGPSTNNKSPQVGSDRVKIVNTDTAFITGSATDKPGNTWHLPRQL